MATNFNENSIVSSGGFKPSSKDTPLDIRTRVETEQDIYEIPNPYIGMIVYVKDTGKRFEILTLKEVDTGLTIKNVVGTYKQFTVDLEEYAKIEDVPTKVSELENDRGYAIEKNVDSKIEAINNTLNSNTNTINSNINTINSNINTINSNINTINTEIDNINTDLTNASENIEGSSISVDSKEGYLKDIEILGNTIQNQNDLADIRSVGDKVEGQELYEIPVLIRGKNLCNSEFIFGILNSTGDWYEDNSSICSKDFMEINSSIRYTLTRYDNLKGFLVSEYDKDKKFIVRQSYSALDTCSYIFSENTKYIKIALLNTRNLSTKIQFEADSIKTPYEQYVEKKLTILSPVQLEKVGDVRDRIICKDGVWGVEKNVYTELLNGQYNFGKGNVLANTAIYQRQFTNLKASSNNIACILSDKFLGVKNNDWELDKESVFLNSDGYVQFRVNHTSIGDRNFAEYTKENNILIKAQLSEPQFIPLPHDQQIKLKTFANKTNIRFECEIEPTIKASVPKSLGATVNTHTEQIDNLGKELDRVKKLEESTVSTVTTESDFTTVENTNNGYFDDVKLKGKTLVNKFVKKAKMPSTVTENGNELVTNTSAIQTVTDLIKFNSDKITFIYEIKGNETITVTDQVLYFRITKNGGSTIAGFKGELTTSYRQVVQVIDVDKESEYVVELRNPCSVKNIMVLEGDHTQNPPEYFEGLKSVGQDVDEITIVTTNAPMFFGKGGKK